MKTLSKQKVVESIALAVVILCAGAVLFSVFEPVISRSQINDTFTVRQQIGDEISFLLAAADVSMSPAIQGLTGGQATGTTRVVVRSNSPTGYTLEMRFSDDPAMQGETTAGVINNYTPAAAGVPDFTFASNSSGGAAEFAYTVNSSSTVDLDQSFLDNGSACNTGSNQTTGRCWLNPSTTNELLIDRATSTPTGGATTTIVFQVEVPSSPSPAVPSDFYRATATLTATNQ